MLRFKVRLSFTIEERTKMQYDNAREAQLETRIVPEICSKSCATSPTNPTAPTSSRCSRREAAAPVSRPIWPVRS